MLALERFIQFVKDSAILRQQLYQIIIAGVALVGAQFDIAFLSEKLEAGLDLGLQFLAIAIAFYTMWTRIAKPAPNLTAAADRREAVLVADGKIATANATHKVAVAAAKQGGFARPLFLALLAGMVMGVLALSGCTGTKAAYKAANEAREASGSFEATAYVVTRQYRNVLRELNELKDAGAFDAPTLARLQAAERVVTPLFIGDPQTATPSLRQLSQVYDEARAAYDAAASAETAADIVEANRLLKERMTRALLELANFLRAIDAVRGA